MGIVTEYYRTRADGVELQRTWSDAGKLIRRDGVDYWEAIDPVDADRVYEETDVDMVVSDSEALAELREVLA